jgi:hypothetical protein
MEITWDRDARSFIRDRKTERAVFRALKRAGGDALRATRAQAKRSTRERVRIRAGYLADRALPLTFPRGATTLNGLEWRMRVSGQAVPLGEYPRRQTKKGVSVEVQKGKRALIASAFLAKSRTGRQSVFLRPGKARYPMGHRLGLNVADTMKDGVTPRVALRRGLDVMGSAFARLFAMELGKR